MATARKVFGAILTKNFKVVIELLQRPDVQSWINSPVERLDAPGTLNRFLHLACREGTAEIVKLSLEAGANLYQLSDGDSYPIFDAMCSQTESAAKVRLLLEKDSKMWTYKDRVGDAAIHLGAAKGNVEAVEVLLEHECNVNQPGEDGKRALHMAAAYGHEELAELLIKKGADVNAEDGQKLTPICPAIMLNRPKLVTLFCDNGVSC